jgi:hypothetical protein
MATLHIEHAITDLTTWREAFDAFAEVRAEAGAVAERISQPVDDERYLVIQLDFDTAEHAAAFLRFLEEHVWSTPSNAPALSGSPRTMILEAAP